MASARGWRTHVLVSLAALSVLAPALASGASELAPHLMRVAGWSTPMPPPVESVAEHGVVGALARLRAAGGGTMYVPRGVWLSPPLNLTSHLTLYLAAGAVLKVRRGRRPHLGAAFLHHTMHPRPHHADHQHHQHHPGHTTATTAGARVAAAGGGKSTMWTLLGCVRTGGR